MHGSRGTACAVLGPKPVKQDVGEGGRVCKRRGGFTTHRYTVPHLAGRIGHEQWRQ